MAFGATRAMQWAMLATVSSLIACAWPVGFGWYIFWRFLAGVTGGVLMVLAAPTVLAGVPPALRGRASGIAFTGVGRSEEHTSDIQSLMRISYACFSLKKPN